ncbi:hypothetical protein [Azohydromonas caseinilytica]|uniref:Uncharacterized protein n=1 Tax=Azohydromonas caseinilytica TaxID=2728836 RepID=A0A848FHQ0_9BURK|nr:hypothetical protein [Azohydromonas caseinilytica]NML19008.1 hypothetical protein [Azohydromonas caseinilytica]
MALVDTSTGLACNGGGTAGSATALLRKGGGCTDTQNSDADFVPGTPPVTSRRIYEIRAVAAPGLKQLSGQAGQGGIVYKT